LFETSVGGAVDCIALGDNDEIGDAAGCDIGVATIGAATGAVIDAVVGDTIGKEGVALVAS